MQNKIHNFFANFFSSKKNTLPTINVQEGENFYEFSSTVNDLLQYKLVTLTSRKQFLYNKFIQTLTPQDKSQIISYIRCKGLFNNHQNIENLQKKLIINQTETSYSYELTQNKKQWFVNFADEHLFGFYQSELFAQDEIQCAEHPLLPHVREAANCLGNQVSPLTCQNKQSTPILIKNVHRLGQVDIRSTQENRQGLYGNNFRAASIQYIDKMSNTFGDNKNLSNFICMMALGYGRGKYKVDEIQFLYETALKSFTCAKQLSDGLPVDIHTGNWGCGAFGNNKIMIACIQLFALHLSGVEEVTYHTFNQEGTIGFNKGRQLYEQFLKESLTKIPNKSIDLNQQFINFLKDQNFCWGQSDGN